jgi:zinc D-Ala-D-Ala carboxypeptidase
MIVTDWTKYPNFSSHEFACKETGECAMHSSFMDKLQSLRKAYGKPMRITSGYRSPRHSIEVAKPTPGAHAEGRACDIAVGPGMDVHRLVELAIRDGFTGIGISQRSGQPRFVHLDTLERIAMWSY